MAADREINRGLERIISAYNAVVGGIEQEAIDDDTRAYGGVIRSAKGRLVVDITKSLIELSWMRLGAEAARIEIGPGRPVRIPLNRGYVDTIREEEVRAHISENIEEYHYDIKSDVHVRVDSQFVLSVECKAYTENAMLKRVLVDCFLIKTRFPNLRFALLQLESQLGGDYSELGDLTYGSRPTHTILSYFDVGLDIITLLKGERHVDRPIHKPEFFKPLEADALEKAVDAFSAILVDYSE